VSKWFAAHIIMYVKSKEVRQTAFPVWENIVLLHADTEEEAFAKAETRGHEGEGDEEGSFRWAGKPARWVYGGVRKLTLCQDADRRPGDGTEITYVQMRLRSRDALRKLIASEPVGLELRDIFAAEKPMTARKN
jgi:hypothetical protein